MRRSERVVLSAGGTRGLRSAADWAAAANPPGDTPDVPVARTTALWIARASLASTALSPAPIAAASKAYHHTKVDLPQDIHF